MKTYSDLADILTKAHERLVEAFDAAYNHARSCRHLLLTPEHLLIALLEQPEFMLDTKGQAIKALDSYINKYIDVVPDELTAYQPLVSEMLDKLIEQSLILKQFAQAEILDVAHVVKAIVDLDGCYGGTVLWQLTGSDWVDFHVGIINSYANNTEDFPYDVWDAPDEADFLFEDSPSSQKADGKNYIYCLNDIADQRNPLIGREHELERTIQVLCRKDKNNPLHVGEAGVGKTAIAYGLAQKINAGEVPRILNGTKIYSLDMGALMAGTQYRGEFEKRFKAVLESLASESRPILYIDEIHTVIGAGRVEGSTIDASNLLKPYLEDGRIRFMGATTYDEYNQSVVRHKAFSRRFEKIDVLEPSPDECKKIIEGIISGYEDFHHVKYTPEAIEMAVTGSQKYITGRFLPDKAIDLIDEAGAWRQLHPDPQAETQTVDRSLIAETLARICHVDTLAENDDDKKHLEHLEDRIKSLVYGQDEAVRRVTEAVMMGSAGLIDDNKPLASLLFVGPTGVGKTEVARVLAQQLNVPLLRYDMSEYAEKHSVAKLIGAPAGYVGYDDGGLLTDAVRKNPRCVLLLDELEKAHSDIYNILLQVMDYAVLTDNRGQKADFRHVVLIMTTNSGAQYSHHGGMGFVKGVNAGQAMMKAVKQTFKPEFINRLTDVTVFNDMDQHMARLILDKKLSDLRVKLSAKGVSLSLTDAAMGWLLQHGFSAQYGGREVERVITSSLKPLLMRQMLFGPLSQGGTANIDVTDDRLVISQTNDKAEEQPRPLN